MTVHRRYLPDRIGLVVRRIAVTLIGLGSIACSGSDSPTEGPSGSTDGSLTITPLDALLLPGSSAQLVATVYDGAGTVAPGASVSWSVDRADIATVSSQGLVEAIMGGTATVTASSGGVSAQAVVGVSLNFLDIAVSNFHQCALTVDSGTYCWGSNISGELGFSPNIRESDVPVPVQGGIGFEILAAGDRMMCGIAEDRSGYCWGSNEAGRLGDGTVENRPTPTSITGTHSFESIGAGIFSGQGTCGVLTGSGVLCWGRDSVIVPTPYGADQTYVEIGVGDEIVALAPNGDLYTVTPGGSVLYQGGVPPLVTMNAGREHFCGLTAAGDLYCWGGTNTSGELGNGTVGASPPVHVAPGTAFSDVSAGGFHTCAVTTNGEAYCWGSNSFGQLGVATTESCLVGHTDLACSTSPILVSADLLFATVGAAGTHACGTTVEGFAYCWGGVSDILVPPTLVGPPINP